MFVLIVGGGKVGSYLTRALLSEGHEVVVVEKQERKARALEQLLETKVTVLGDGCDPYVLRDAGVGRADVVVADTGDDEDNLVVVLIAKRQANKPRCIARVNNPRNKMIFESIDPEDPVVAISSTEIILDILNEHVNAAKYKQVAASISLFNQGSLELVQMTVPSNSPIVGNSLGTVAFPHNSAVVAVNREGQDLLIPTGESTLAAGDRLLIIAKKGAVDAVRAILAGSAA